MKTQQSLMRVAGLSGAVALLVTAATLIAATPAAGGNKGGLPSTKYTGTAMLTAVGDEPNASGMAALDASVSCILVGCSGEGTVNVACSGLIPGASYVVTMSGSSVYNFSTPGGTANNKGTLKIVSSNSCGCCKTISCRLADVISVYRVTRSANVLVLSGPITWSQEKQSADISDLPAVLSATTSATPTRTIPVGDPNWFFSPGNWYVNGSTFAQSQSPGAYFALRFTGTQAALAVDVASLRGAGVQASSWPLIRWQIDSTPPQYHRLKQADSLIQLNSEALAPGAHSLRLWFVGADPFQDRWFVPVECVRVTGLVLDAAGSTLAPALRPGRMVFFGDSITEGLATECITSYYSNPGCNDATHAYTYACAAALNAEFGVLGFSGQGWTVSADYASGVPPFPEAWELQFAGQPRSFVPAPDYVVVAEGANDGLFGTFAPGDLANALQTWLGDARAVLRKSKIFVVVPFGGYERDELTQGFNAYQAAADDRNAYLIDLGPEAEEGLNSGFVKGGTLTSYDGVHPTAARSPELGAMLAQAIQQALGN